MDTGAAGVSSDCLVVGPIKASETLCNTFLPLDRPDWSAYRALRARHSGRGCRRGRPDGARGRIPPDGADGLGANVRENTHFGLRVRGELWPRSEIGRRLGGAIRWEMIAAVSVLIQNCFVFLPYEDSDCGGRAFVARDHAARGRTGGVRGRDGGDLRRGRRQGGGIQLRLHSAGHHAPRRQRVAPSRTDPRVAQARERDYHFGPQLDRGQGLGAGAGRG